MDGQGCWWPGHSLQWLDTAFLLCLPLLLAGLLRLPAILSNKLKLKFAYFLSFNLLIYSLFLP